MHLWSASHCIYSPNRHSDTATRAAGRHRNEWGDIDNRLKKLSDALRGAGCATRDRIEHQTILGQRTSLHPTGGRCAHRAYQRRNRSTLGRAGSQSSAAQNPGEQPCQSSDFGQSSSALITRSTPTARTLGRSQCRSRRVPVSLRLAMRVPTLTRPGYRSACGVTAVDGRARSWIEPLRLSLTFASSARPR
jgi:hypothetical protein